MTIKIPFIKLCYPKSLIIREVRVISKTQYRRLYKMINEGNTIKDASAKAGIDPKTARRYLSKDNPLQSPNHNWKTRKNPFEVVWEEISNMLSLQPRLEAKTIFSYLLDKYPGRFQEGQLRTLQRKVKKWKGLEGEPKEVFFAQIHKPGDLCASDFTHMDELKVTIQSSPFSHLVYHFVLTYSNWESATVCFSENLESLSEGFQNALWQLGGSARHLQKKGEFHSLSIHIFQSFQENRQLFFSFMLFIFLGQLSIGTPFASQTKRRKKYAY